MGKLQSVTAGLADSRGPEPLASGQTRSAHGYLTTEASRPYHGPQTSFVRFGRSSSSIRRAERKGCARQASDPTISRVRRAGTACSPKENKPHLHFGGRMAKSYKACLSSGLIEKAKMESIKPSQTTSVDCEVSRVFTVAQSPGAAEAHGSQGKRD